MAETLLERHDGVSPPLNPFRVAWRTYRPEWYRLEYYCHSRPNSRRSYAAATAPW